MIKPKIFLNTFKKNGMLFFAGVPDSVLKNFSNNPRIALPFNIIFQ